MKTKLSTLVLSALFGLTVCSVDDSPVIPVDNPDNNSWEEPDLSIMGTGL